ncbi:hypothetical protein C8Q74DRAFT_4305 [Fomes fomentarius]|nr:hypothetical protein C8Q74DRAFT_4305 [Fomes fomentarius]
MWAWDCARDIGVYPDISTYPNSHSACSLCWTKTDTECSAAEKMKRIVQCRRMAKSIMLNVDLWLDHHGASLYRRRNPIPVIQCTREIWNLSAALFEVGDYKGCLEAILRA